MYKLIIFDLDGTLADTSAGIYGAYHFVCEQLGISLNEDSLNGVIGGNLLQIFKDRFGLDEFTARKAVDVYRNWYEKNGVYQADLYPGMKEVLACLSEKYNLGVATLKREDFAKKILMLLKIDNYFQLICGMDEGDTFNKEQIISKCMKGLNAAPNETLLVGDSMSDYNGAIANNTDFLAVTYGFGFNGNHDDNCSYAIGFADKAEELLHLIMQ